jgi:hypothetical protein
MVVWDAEKHSDDLRTIDQKSEVWTKLLVEKGSTLTQLQQKISEATGIPADEVYILRKN